MIGEVATVCLGSRVQVRCADADEDDEYVVVGPEAERVPDAVSSASPLGRALLGTPVGDWTTVRAPGGAYRVRVLGVCGEADR